MKLWCLEAGANTSAFYVRVDECDSVRVLKRAIATTAECSKQARNKTLYLCKKGESWLTAEDARRMLSTTDLQCLDCDLAILHEVGLSEEAVAFQVEDGKDSSETWPVHVLLVNASLTRPLVHEVDIKQVYLSRKKLQGKLLDKLNTSTFVLLNAPSGSGKTTLLKCFALHQTKHRCELITFQGVVDPTAESLVQHIDEVVAKAPHDVRGLRVLVVDDCHALYQVEGFWCELIDKADTWFEQNVRVVLSGIHSLTSGAPGSPIALKQVTSRLSSEDFLVDPDEAHSCFCDLGIWESSWTFPTLKSMIVYECGGHIGTLRAAIQTIHQYFVKTIDIIFKSLQLTEEVAIKFYMSGSFLKAMTLFFDKEHTVPSSPEVRECLSKCAAGIVSNGMVATSTWSDDEAACVTRLTKAGILTQVGHEVVDFASPLAKRYYFLWLFPRRAMVNPPSLHELVLSSIRSLSVSALRQSVVAENEFPKEATFQHLMMHALALNTQPNCCVCPELSKRFPSRQSQAPLGIKGEIDFFLNGDLRWGIELLVQGRNVGEHLNRFGAGGKYERLEMTDYAVIDFRPSRFGEPTKVALDGNRYTVFFAPGNSRTCQCVYGSPSKTETLNLMP